MKSRNSESAVFVMRLASENFRSAENISPAWDISR